MDTPNDHTDSLTIDCTDNPHGVIVEARGTGKYGGRNEILAIVPPGYALETNIINLILIRASAHLLDMEATAKMSRIWREPKLMTSGIDGEYAFLKIGDRRAHVVSGLPGPVEKLWPGIPRRSPLPPAA